MEPCFNTVNSTSALLFIKIYCTIMCTEISFVPSGCGSQKILDILSIFILLLIRYAYKATFK